MSTTAACPKNLVANGIQLLEHSGHKQLRVVLAHDPAKCERFAEKDHAPLQKNLERDLGTNEDICPTKSRIRFEGRARSACATLSWLAATKIIGSQANPRGTSRGDLGVSASVSGASNPASYFKTIAVNG
jgi:hypothetical protein